MRDSGARPPAMPTEPPPVEERVRIIALEMEHGTWNSAKCRDLASRWGLDPSTVRDSSAEAARSLRSLERPAAVARVEALLEQAARDSKGDPHALVKVVTATMKLYGLDRPVPAASGASGSSGARNIKTDAEDDDEDFGSTDKD